MLELARRQFDAALVHCATLRANAPRLGDSSELPFADVIEAAALHALGRPADLAGALARLRAADAPRYLALALACLAEQATAAGELDTARRHATEALDVATRADRDPEARLAGSLLAQLGA